MLWGCRNGGPDFYCPPFGGATAPQTQFFEIFFFLPVKNKKTKIKIIPVLEPPLHAQSIRKKIS